MITRHRQSNLELARITLAVQEEKEFWTRLFQETPKTAMNTFMERYGVARVSARNICDAVGIPRLKHARKPKPAPTPAPISLERIDQMEIRLNRLSAWCEKLAADLNQPLP